MNLRTVGLGGRAAGSAVGMVEVQIEYIYELRRLFDVDTRGASIDIGKTLGSTRPDPDPTSYRVRIGSQFLSNGS